MCGARSIPARHYTIFVEARSEERVVSHAGLCAAHRNLDVAEICKSKTGCPQEKTADPLAPGGDGKTVGI